MNQSIWINLLSNVIVVGVLVGCAGSPARPSLTATPTNVAASTPLASGKSRGKLSARLEMLANSPTLRVAGVDEQARALGLPPQGAGGLMRDAQGRILVNIRMTDIAQPELQALTNAGAIITNVAENYRMVTAFVAPADLPALANLAAIESVQEELEPGTGGGGGVVIPTP